MRNLLLRNTSLRLLLVAAFAGLPLTLALGHEGHHAECNETTINALKAVVEAPPRPPPCPPSKATRLFIKQFVTCLFGHSCVTAIGSNNIIWLAQRNVVSCASS
jgi:hypothetical protein